MWTDSAFVLHQPGSVCNQITTYVMGALMVQFLFYAVNMLITNQSPEAATTRAVASVFEIQNQMLHVAVFVQVCLDRMI